jgi:hypothetical protein
VTLTDPEALPSPSVSPYPGVLPSPGAAPEPSASPVPETTSEPTAAPVPGTTSEPTAAPVPGTISEPTASPVPGTSPNSPPQTSDNQTMPGNEAVPGSQPNSPPIVPESLPGPLTDHIPPFDTTSLQALTYKKAMDVILEKAVKVSGIKSTYGLFIMDLKTGFYYGVNENLTQTDTASNLPEGYFNSASVIKLFQGYLFCDMIRRGELDSEKIYYDKVTGRKFKLLPMLKSMISYSDNNYSNACLRIVDNKKSNEVLSHLGIKNSRLYGEMSGAIGYSRQNNIKMYGTEKRCARITPLDAGFILYNIYCGKDADQYMKLMNEALLGNIYNTRIPVGVRRVSSKYRIAHKTGTNSAIGVYNDAGIIYTENPFILVAFTSGTTSGTGHSFIRSLAENLTKYFMR